MTIIQFEQSHQPDVMESIADPDRYQLIRYPPESNHLIDIQS